MAKRILLTTLGLAVLAVLAIVTGPPAQAATSVQVPATGAAVVCDTFGIQDDILSNNGTRWGYVNLVNSAACNHWGSVAMLDPVPVRHQVNVTLTRYYYGVLIDHRYCKVTPDGTDCHTPAILTTDCNAWSYQTVAEVRRWSPTTDWTTIAIGGTGVRASC